MKTYPTEKQIRLFEDLIEERYVPLQTQAWLWRRCVDGLSLEQSQVVVDMLRHYEKKRAKP